MSARSTRLALAAAALSLAACRDNKVATYRVPKETDPTPPPAADASAPANTSGNAMASTPVATAAGDALVWTAPATWKAKAPGAMRKGSYSVPGEAGTEADFSITAFPGDVGGEAANINRWRGQTGLPPIANGEVDAAVTRFEKNGLKFSVIELVNKDAAAAAQHMLAAQVPFSGSTWFFKLAGPDTLVASQKAAFFAFLETVKPGGAAVSEPVSTTSGPVSTPAAPTVTLPPTLSAPATPSMASTAVPTASGSGLAWSAPAGWTAKAPGAMRKGSYTVSGSGGDADLAITAFPGEVGGELANLNRWRGQVGLPPFTAAQIESNVTRIEQNGLRLVLVDFVNPSAPAASQHMVAALVPFAGSTWFFKLSGPDATVAVAKPAFLEFLKTIKAAQ